MSAALTVIMPAWNAEKTVEYAVRSVLTQTYRDLRLIVVDDGSTDETAAILRRLAAEDARLTPMTVPNGGPAKARNLALDAMDADTRYVMFIDADDVLLPDAAEKAVREAEAGAQLVLFGFSILGVDRTKRDYCEPSQRLTRAELGGALGRLYKANLLNQVWGKLFSAELIRAGQIRFPDYRWGEDRFFVFACLEGAAKISVLEDCLYQYIMSAGESLISKYYDKKFAVCCEIDARMEAMCRALGVTDERDFRYMFAKSVFSCLTVLYAPSCPLDDRQKREAAREIVTDERVRRRCRDCSGGLPVNALCAVLQAGKPDFALAVFRSVAWTSKAAPGLFTALKHRK